MKATFQTMAGNPENQDRGAIIECDSKSVLVIADGAGGLSGAAESAAMAVDLVRQQASALDGPDSCVSLLRNVDRAIAQDRVAGQTTCVIAVIAGESVYGASAGDSEAWAIGEKGRTDLTSRQIRKPLLGSGCASPVSFACNLGNGQKLLLATDGLFKYSSPERIENICRIIAPDSVPKHLIELVRYASGALPDDITIVFADLQRHRMNDKDIIRTSKFLSLILRHEPERVGLKLDDAGWVAVDELLNAVNQHGTPLSLEQLKHIVATSDKKRFAFSDDSRRIRANQGHSVEVDLQYAPQTPPELLYHGTAIQFLDSIRKDGLQRMERHDVHLSAETKRTLEVGGRRGKPVLLTIRAGDMHRAGHEFRASANGVWLVKNVPPEFIEFPAT